MCYISDFSLTSISYRETSSVTSFHGTGPLLLLIPLCLLLISECICLSLFSQLSSALSFSYVLLQQQSEESSESICNQNKNSSLIRIAFVQYLNHTSNKIDYQDEALYCALIVKILTRIGKQRHSKTMRNNLIDSLKH